MHNFCTVGVKNSEANHKAERTENSQNLLYHFIVEGDSLLIYILTYPELWVHQYS